MKKTRVKKSRDTVPLSVNFSSFFCWCYREYSASYYNWKKACNVHNHTVQSIAKNKCMFHFSVTWFIFNLERRE
jgi:hypothetical protein